MKPLIAAISTLLVLVLGTDTAPSLSPGASPMEAGATQVACGNILTTDTRLDSDLLNCPGNGLVIDADSITVDCACHTISGADSTNYGIFLNGHTGVTVKNCFVTNFNYGFLLSGSDGNTE